MTKTWRWAGARSKGTSHDKTGAPCQDYGCVAEVSSATGPVFIALVADGAGSASHAAVGSKLVAITALRSARTFLQSAALSALTEDEAWDWVDAIRDRINREAARLTLKPRDFASTLIIILADSIVTRIIHIGDGAAVLKTIGSEEWVVPSWPFQGEYASTTSFVTDDPQPRLVLSAVDQPASEIAIFSDGIERMVLDHLAKTAHAPFFERMLSPIRTLSSTGRDGPLSKALGDYLSSSSVCERTDDDKTLILGARG